MVFCRFFYAYKIKKTKAIIVVHYAGVGCEMNQILRIEDADASANDVQVPFRFYPCLVAGLAYYISQKRAPERMEALKAMYEDEFARALAQDESRASLMVKPNMRSYGY